ncbi:ubiquinone biosynthesis accessory factor UbiJ [Bordetella avium]|uniref:Ubiquinone biosynthesis accessory factor UbiJ n=1 Tax=Bordetella avium (strain 197N) TaxID=360910 RepID=Q2KUH4_BORA1|nr:SCP2 sterol-binding domain-containing protein [Bordetella avium]AZY53810.1 hypothetical protein C0J07_15995 [Bordetella avium]RIQ15417.1 hypothetical protein D0432_04675 [Bordetella avium]RIQ38473.1 hypothetical protein D0848_07570 [Bordetella avium]RIQ43012.1 hypothetical protein D0847_07550 [Bordetella avium]RIQ44053.1 hypothetical protein D0846_08390 [Bordetella avium]
MLPALPTPTRFALRALNTLLDREAWARERLARHGGKTVRFALNGFGLSLTIDNEGRVQESDPAIVPDVTLSALPERLSLLQFLPGSPKPDMAEVTHISGDAALAQVVADLARDLRWDAQDDLARVIGDIPALRLTAGLQAFLRGTREAARRMAGNTAEYLAEESRVLAGRPVFEQWRLDLTELQQDTDRLARSIGALQSRLAALPLRGNRS